VAGEVPPEGAVVIDQLARTLRDQGDRVTTGWAQFDEYVRLRPKILVNVFSQAGVGKSLWALNLVYRIGVPAFYSTTDTPLGTQALRVWSLLSGKTIREVEENPKQFMRAAQRLRTGLPHVEWNDVPINVDDLGDLLDAVRERQGPYPRVSVIDVVGDVVRERSYEGFTHAFAVLKAVAFANQATVITLHHTTKKKKSKDPVVLKDVEYAGDKQPDVVIGLYKKRRMTIRANILKNRLGPSDPEGGVHVDFRVDYARGKVEEWNDG
jgi:hypothetical protein